MVDDTPSNLEILSELLAPDYQVSVATNGFDALALAGSDPSPDLILLDIMMPRLDGYQVCEQLKAQESTRQIPVIFVTATSDFESEEYGLNMGAVDYITKPFTPSIILARIRTHLALSNKTRLLQRLIRDRTAELEKARDAAEQAHKAKSNFLANMSHELRTPLNGIMGMTRLLMETTDSEDQREFLKDSWESSSRLLTMVNDLLELSSAESGNLLLCAHCFQARDALASLLQHYRQWAHEKGLGFHVSFSDDIPPRLCADLDRIRQVLMNLLNNAMRFT